MKVGLTGGIASGKSTAADFLRELGAKVIDSDELAHRAIAPGQPAHDEVIAHFGTGIMNADGTINRSRLGEIVFADPEQRAVLNQIVHPRVRAEWQRQAAALESSSRATIVLAMIPLLYETGVESAFQAVVVVACEPETQRARMRARGLTDNQVAARLDAQLPMPTKMVRADFVIWNEYSLNLLELQTRAVWHRLSTN